MISVIMPVWNGSRFLDRAIASVAAQTSPAWELLIVDDGSDDDSLARAWRWRDLVNAHASQEKLRVYSTGRSHTGPQSGRNLAARKARYDIFAYLDQDDLYFPRRIESILASMDQCDLLFSPYEIWKPEGLSVWNLWSLWQQRSYVCSSDGDREPRFDVWLRAGVERVEPSVPLGVAHRREIFEAVGGFQPGIIVGQSGVLWRRMINRGARIGFCPVVAGRYHVCPDSLSRTYQPFSTGGFRLDKTHPSGPNGQYLDLEWFASLEEKSPAEETAGFASDRKEQL